MGTRAVYTFIDELKCVSVYKHWDGYGDGTYPVFAEFNEHGRIAKVWVEFIAQDDEADEA